MRSLPPAALVMLVVRGKLPDTPAPHPSALSLQLPPTSGVTSAAGECKCNSQPSTSFSLLPQCPHLGPPYRVEGVSAHSRKRSVVAPQGTILRWDTWWRKCLLNELQVFHFDAWGVGSPQSRKTSVHRRLPTLSLV